MSNEITTEKPDAIKILEAKINAFNKQWQGYNQNWTNISKITLESEESTYNQYGVTLIFSKGIIKYDKNTVDDTNEKIIVTRVDNQLYYYLYNLPNNCGICIKEENSICYITEDETQTFSLNNFVYRNENEFIIVENQKESDDYFTIDWNEEKWAVINVIKTQSTTIDRIDNLVPIIKCFTINNEEILADIKIESTTTTKTNNNETIITNIYQVLNIPYCVSYLMVR